MAESPIFSSNVIWSFVHENTTLLFLAFALIILVLKQVSRTRAKKLPPGPVGLPIVGYLPYLGAEPHKSLQSLSQKYGNIMSLRLGPKLTVVLNDYNTMKEGLSHPATLGRPPELFDHLKGLGFGSKNGEEWQEQRRFSLHAMRDLGLGKGAWQNIVKEEVTSFTEILHSYRGKAVDISYPLSCSISSNVLSLLIGRKLEKGKDDEKINTLVECTNVAFTYVAPSLITTLIPGLRKISECFRLGDYYRTAKVILKFLNLVKEEIRNHRFNLETKGSTDFINLYLEEKEAMSNKNTKHYFCDDNLEGNVKTLFLGASDTVFSSMGWLFRLMAEHRDIQKKVQEELDDVIGRDGTVLYEERFKVPYTFAVMMEAQRYSSIVPISTTRIASFDFKIQGYTIPKGIEMISNLWALHNDTEYWDEPEKFKPERFLTDNNKKLIMNKPSYAPFSAGKRKCPGETIAWMEILAYFTSIMQKFTIAVPPGEKPKFDIVNGLVSHLKPQPLCFIERPG